ncbi:hypothetical protein TGPRC2_223845 [Toxoplasma gondii TgCatPRC2]|uniref:Uncharacterized protein n=11 Tax=Toxoplasma gondii TaxID=5811 RepID=A0A125YR03_TOXGV|nr:hypothetical protein TGME49_223845 [Toxoplasma gondii ME49]EPR62004.1 hypothetical protein TGGT1_223845 [Toxoplasma gondii GT1]ESS32366.1 hypothetical protein TGVEG_223845 [Toxoplasma gondii VEG]KAF4640437.1 hypothetical protein TGRH88_043630 [Toxoplasma gondii]KFG45814.1 hypothetical protein TGDOM2_223845 [Toxoplasma gondii GAB2-2007-GAL-DOM2]KFG58186.1 hypothetical protein TGRUB_223845 [Toxoplasma gondii RUB]KFH13597.1 hypothetical protein TGVAND_223845 [Toxoplasma gondii VAND]KFH18127.|eukprot:XP_018635915.1 hypothetical protein TGME49_223845 [Toxoplasma gondii ME49]
MYPIIWVAATDKYHLSLAVFLPCGFLISRSHWPYEVGSALFIRVGRREISRGDGRFACVDHPFLKTRPSLSLRCCRVLRFLPRLSLATSRLILQPTSRGSREL